MITSSTQAGDRAFLEELLVYLRQQRRQLDESRHLLERLEEQQRRMAAAGSSGRGGVETAQSGTLPSRTATSGGQVSSAPVRQWSPFLLSLMHSPSPSLSCSLLSHTHTYALLVALLSHTLLLYLCLPSITRTNCSPYH